MILMYTSKFWGAFDTQTWEFYQIGTNKSQDMGELVDKNLKQDVAKDIGHVIFKTYEFGFLNTDCLLNMIELE